MMKSKFWLAIATGALISSACSGDVSDLGEVDKNSGASDEDTNGSEEAGSSSVTTTGGLGVTGDASGEGSASVGVGGGFAESVVTTVSGTVGGDATGGSGGAGEVGSVETSVTTVSGTVGGMATGGSGGDGWGVAESAVTTVGTVGGVGTGGGPAEIDCLSEECPGLCFGTSCDNVDWVCHANVTCEVELVEWCGCDGETFMASRTCPSRAFAHVGPCE